MSCYAVRKYSSLKKLYFDICGWLTIVMYSCKLFVFYPRNYEYVKDFQYFSSKTFILESLSFSGIWSDASFEFYRNLNAVIRPNPQKDSDSIVPARIQIYLCQLPLQNKRARPILDKEPLIFLN